MVFGQYIMLLYIINIGHEFGLEVGNGLPADGLTFLVDTTAPFLVSEGTQLTRSGNSTPTPFSFPQLNVGTNENTPPITGRRSSFRS